MANAGTVTLNLDANSVKLLRELQRSQRATERTAKKMRGSMVRSFKAIRAAVLSATTVLAAFAAFRGFARITGEIDKIGKLVDRLGGSTEAFSELRFVAERSGVTFETMTMGLQRMSRRVAEAAVGMGEAQGALRELNISAEALAKLPLDQQFEKIAGALSQVENESDKTRLAMKLFDSEGVALLQTMTDGAEGIAGLREEARRLGVSLSTDQVNAATAAKDAFTNFNAQVDALKINLTLGLLPAIQWTVDQLNKLFDQSLRMRTARARQNIEWLEALGLDPKNSRTLKNAYKTLQDLLKEGSERIANAGGTQYADRSFDIANALNIWKAADAELTELFSVSAKKENDEFTRYVRQHESDVQRMIRERQELYRMAEMGALPEGMFERRLREISAIWSEGIEEIDISRLPKKIKPALKEMDEYAKQAARNIQDAFAEFLFDPFEDGLKGMLRSFVDTLRKMVANQLAAQVAGWFSGFNFFGLGGRATGGPVAAGAPYMVGERGPELFIPGSSGTVIPNNRLTSGGNVFNFTNNVTSNGSMDAQTLIPILEENNRKVKSEFLDELNRGQYD